MRIAITGHQDLKNRKWVEENLEKEIQKLKQASEDCHEKLVGISSLAIGADQLFASTLLKHGGELIVVLPFDGYERTHEDGLDRKNYYKLLNEASSKITLHAQATDQESYFEAGKCVVDISDIIITVWDNKKAKGLGGTGDVVKYAKSRGKMVIHLNPITCEMKTIE